MTGSVAPPDQSQGMENPPSILTDRFDHALAYANHLELAQLQARHGLRLSSKAWLAPEGEARQASGVLFEDGIENLSACNVVG